MPRAGFESEREGPTEGRTGADPQGYAGAEVHKGSGGVPWCSNRSRLKVAPTLASLATSHYELAAFLSAGGAVQ
jgi:hypothetical protein